MEIDALKRIIEAALLAAGQPLSIVQLRGLFDEEAAPTSNEVAQALAALVEDCSSRGVELREVASGWRFQVVESLMPWVSRLHADRPPRYSRALLETLALIAYRQPVTRGEIEAIRGVSVSTQIIRTLEERDWIRVVGFRDVPGKPALLGTNKAFLDYFNLKSLDELPPLSALRDFIEVDPELPFAIDGQSETRDQRAAANVAVLSASPTHMDESDHEIDDRDSDFDPEPTGIPAVAHPDAAAAAPQEESLE